LSERYPRLANLVGALTLALSDTMRDATESAADQTAAGPSTLIALSEFLDHPTVDEVRRVVGLTHSGGVRLVDRLEAQGYIARRPGRDARSVSLVLTAKGRRAAERVRIARASAFDSVLAVLTHDEQRSLASLTEKLLAAITEQRLRDRARDRLPPGGWLCRLCDFEACGRPRGDCPVAAAASHSATRT
jgi:DNA-binding MarR family transcriptional regulator